MNDKTYPAVNWPATEIKDLKDDIRALEAARDHLRARLHRQIEFWRGEAARIDRTHATMGIGWKSCAADLLAVLTEPVEDDKNKKENNLARVVTMGEGIDSRTASEASAGSVEPPTPDQVRIEVANEMRFLVAGPDTDEDVVTLKQSLRRRLLAWAERLETNTTGNEKEKS